MKKIFRNLMMLLCALTALVSCDESGDKIYLNGFEASGLMASASDVTLSLDNRSDLVLSLAWKNPTLLSSDETKPATDKALTTTLQVSASEDFASTKDYPTTTLSKAFTGKDLNAVANGLALTPEQSVPMYFRIKSQLGANQEPVYSNVCKVNVNSYLIHMNSMAILSSDKSKTLTTLYSPEENGIYTGYMNASAWLNFYGMENDGTVWGNYGADGHVFEADNTTSAWNFWFPGVAGIYYTVVDTKAKEWKATALTAMTLNGEAMTYDAPNYAWVKVITTSADNASISIAATGAEYNKSTGTDDAKAVSKTMNYSLADGKMTDAETAGSVNIEKAGTYTVTVKVGEKGELTYSIVAGDQTSPEPEASNTLCMFDENGNTLKAVMTKVSDGIYTCKYKPATWENFKFIFVGTDKDDKQTWYGSDPTDLFKLSTAADCWNIWFKDDVTGEEMTITADLNTMTWKYE